MIISACRLALLDDMDNFIEFYGKYDWRYNKYE